MVCQENFGREREGRGAEQVLQVDVRTLRQGRCRGGPSRQAGQSGNRGVYQRRRARCARRSRRERSRSARAPPDGGRCPPWPGAGSWRRPHTAPPARGMPPRLGGEAPDLSRVGRHGWQRQRATTRCAHGQPAPAFTRRGGARTRYSDDAARRRSGSAGSTLAAGRAVSKPPTRSRTHRTRAGSHRPRSSNSE